MSVADVDLLSSAVAIRAADELNRMFDPDGIGRARMERHRDHAAQTSDWLAERLCWSNYWRAKESERLRWLSLGERVFG